MIWMGKRLVCVASPSACDYELVKFNDARQAMGLL